jgi:hypothetical protein
MFSWWRLLTGVRTLGLVLWICVALSLGLSPHALAGKSEQMNYMRG